MTGQKLRQGARVAGCEGACAEGELDPGEKQPLPDLCLPVPVILGEMKYD